MGAPISCSGMPKASTRPLACGRRSRHSPFMVPTTALDRFAHSFIAYGKDFAVIFEAAKNDPDCLMARAQAALLGLFMENKAGLALAKTHLDAGRALADQGKASEREQLYFRAIGAASRAGQPSSWWRTA